MQRLRLRYAKRGRLRFTSHRDVARAFERALRRAGVPMAYSQGFSPHPKISWAGAAPTGVASEAEYVEIQVAERVDPEVVRAELNAALPDGLDVLRVVPASGNPLPERIDASLWRIELPGVDPRTLRAAVDRLLAAERVEVQRLTKDGRRTLDVRPVVVSAQVLSGAGAGRGAGEPGLASADFPGHMECDTGGVRPPARELDEAEVVAERSHLATATARTDDWPVPGRPCGILVTVVRQATPAVRPDDVLSALRVVAGLEPPVPAKATRMAQGRLDDEGRLADPLAPMATEEPARGDLASGQGVVAGPAV